MPCPVELIRVDRLSDWLRTRAPGTTDGTGIPPAIWPPRGGY